MVDPDDVKLSIEDCLEMMPQYMLTVQMSCCLGFIRYDILIENLEEETIETQWTANEEELGTTMDLALSWFVSQIEVPYQ